MPASSIRYELGIRTLTMAEALLGEDPRVMAAGLAHELKHASDFDLVALGLVERVCTELEVRAFEAEAIVARAPVRRAARIGSAGCR